MSERKRRVLPKVVDTHVHVRLQVWASWFVRKIDGGPIGYPQDTLCRLMKYGGGTIDGATYDTSSEPDQAETQATHTFVMRLPADLQQLVNAYWVRSWPQLRIAKTLNVAPKTISDRFARLNGLANEQLFTTRKNNFPMCSTASTLRQTEG
ncbi:MAG: hypothetical protein AB3X44_16220 [Leptothrix sp. (in: b-proteobacteria)]